MSVSPASFPGSSAGYRAYVKAVGFDINDPRYQTYYMEKGRFMAIDRRPIEDRVEDAVQRSFLQLCQMPESAALTAVNDAMVSLHNSLLPEFIEAGLSAYLVKRAENFIDVLPENNLRAAAQELITAVQNSVIYK